MKKKLLFILITFLFFSCSHRINRIGYHLKSTDYRDCELPLQFGEKAEVNDVKIGEIHFGDCKNSRIKSKEDVMNIVRKEGCSIGASYANIEIIDSSSSENSCYKCRAIYFSENKQMNKYPDQNFKNKSSTLTQRRVLEIGIAILTIYILASIIIRI